MSAIQRPRLRFRLSLPVPVRRLFWLFFVTILTLLPCLADAQSSENTVVNREEPNRIAIQHLNAGDTAKALKSLDAVGEATTPISMTQPDPLAPACARLHRALSQLSSEEQFDLLSAWSIPAGANRIRMLTAIVPTGAPPAEFARALGERPRASSFQVSSIGEVRGIYSSAWSLVVAARESGKLKRLIADLTTLVEKKVPKSDGLLMLAQIADGRGDVARLKEELSKLARQLKAGVPTTAAGPGSLDPSSIVLAAACLQHPELRPLGEEMFETLVACTYAQPARVLRPFLRQALATAMLVNRGKSDAALVLAQRFKYWLPVAGELTGPNAVWLTHDDHLLHLSGSGDDQLFFRYPLHGTFQFHLDTQSGGRFETEGGLVFGELHFQPSSSTFALDVSNSQGTTIGKRFCYFVYPGVRPTYQHLTLESSHAATVSVNRHSMWHDPDAVDCPWFGLRSLDERNPLFRNVKLTGNPVIPRSVSLSQGKTLRGWQNLIDGEPRMEEGSAAWKLSANIIEAFPGRDEAHVEHLLSFQRPVVAGESVSYEFLHVPGKTEVSPALGRVVFLLQTDGVRLHWMTNGSREWTGLDADNSVVEPLNRRGPRPLPLKANDWNRITLTRSGQSVTLTLNDVAIYERPVDWTGDHRFGFYRHRKATGAQVRNVTLSGDWPESVPEEFHESPLAVMGPALLPADRQTFDRLFRDDFLSENVFVVRRRSLAMPLADRFEFLSRWVLPGPDHAGFRVAGDFTPTRPAPVGLEPATSQPELGGQIVSPVYDWLDAARELGRLDECRRRVEAAVIDERDLDSQSRVTGFQNRARAALFLLLSIEKGDSAGVLSDAGKLSDLLRTQTPIEISDQWPETLVADHGFCKMPQSPGVQEIVSHLYSQRTMQWRPAGIGVWHTHVAAIHGRLKLLKSGTSEAQSEDLHEWIPVSISRSVFSGEGFPNATWHRHGTRVVKVAGHDEDFLFYRQPLSGNFEVECDVVEPSSAPTQLLLAGTFSGLHWDLKNLDVGTIRGAGPIFPLERPVSHQGAWVRYRSVIRDGNRTDSMNGHLVQRRSLPDHVDPWVGIRVWGRFQSSFQNVRITGHPTVLNAVSLSDSNELTGWSSYHDDSVADAEKSWKHVDAPDSSGEIIGRRETGLAGNYHEGLLRYQRPLVEDGTIEYEFYYEPGMSETHPALDRLALLLHPSGVREHWITDHRKERTDLASNNSVEQAQYRRGPSDLPLNARDWNHVKLTVRGMTLKLELNRQLVYERALERTNQRMFGLFHFVDISEVRVRNVVMRGDWPKSLRPLAEQELAGPVNPLDADRPRLAARFTHDFQKDGLPDTYFKPVSPPNGVMVSPGSDGLRVNVTASGTWIATEITPRFRLAGDFDIEATFANLHVQVQKGDSGIILLANMDDQRKSVYGISRVLNEAGFQGSQCSQSMERADGSRSWQAEVTPNSSVNGRLRMARRGTKLSYLFAEEDSEIFRTFHSETMTDAATESGGIRLHSLCTSAGTSQVIWKKLDLRAEKMTWLREGPESSTLMLRVVQADGKGLKTIATPNSIGLTHLGSPEWSPDGRKIAFDMSNGTTSSSRIVVINADGSDMKDLGSGCMPSFSRDGSRIVLSLHGEGVVTIKPDGQDLEVIDRFGWGSQWSPDGKSIAYLKSANITVLDLKSQDSRTLLTGEAATRYNSLFWSLGWSNDSRYIGFKARRRDTGKCELGVVEVASGEFKVLHTDAATAIEDFMWSPDNEQLIVGIQNPLVQGPQLYSINRKNPGPPQLLPAQPRGQKSYGYAWSRDGKRIVLASMKVPVPVKWITGPVEEPE